MVLTSFTVLDALTQAVHILQTGLVVECWIRGSMVCTPNECFSILLRVKSRPLSHLRITALKAQWSKRNKSPTTNLVQRDRAYPFPTTFEQSRRIQQSRIQRLNDPVGKRGSCIPPKEIHVYLISARRL